MSKSGEDNIKVVCRMRPPNKLELAEGGKTCVEYGEKKISVKVN